MKDFIDFAVFKMSRTSVWISTQVCEKGLKVFRTCLDKSLNIPGISPASRGWTR